MLKVLLFVILSQIWVPQPDGSLQMDYDGPITITIPRDNITSDIIVPDDYSTIQDAVDAAEADNTIIVREGTYNEYISFNGVPANVTLRGKGIVKGFNTTGAEPGLTIEGFTVTNPETKFAINIGSDNVTIRNNYLHEVHYSIHVSGWPIGGVIEGNHIEDFGMGIFTRGDGWLIKNNDLERPRRWGHDVDWTRVFGDGVLITGNYFHNASRADIGASHIDGMQSFTRNGPAATNFLFEGNIVVGFGQGLMLEAQDGSISGVVRNNIFVGDFIDDPGSGGWGINAKYETILVVKNNYFMNINHHGAGFRFGAEGIVQDNWFYNAGSNYGALTTDSKVIGGGNIMNQLSWRGLPHPDDTLDPDMVLVYTPPTSMPFNIEDSIK